MPQAVRDSHLHPCSLRWRKVVPLPRFYKENRGFGCLRETKGNKMKYGFAIAAALAALLTAGTAAAADHQVQMLNRGEKGMMVFQPDFVVAQPGDTVTFVPTDKGHSVESIKGMLPDGAESFKGGISQKITVTLDKQGVYGVKCGPHYPMGMVALIVVGKPTNLQQAEAIHQPGLADKRFKALFAQVQQED